MPHPPTNILVTMAGNGDRFRRAGYAVPKFKIEARGRTLFSWAMLSLRQFIETRGQVVFAARPDHDPGEFIRREAASLGIGDYRVVPIERLTDGQATTALVAGAAVDDHEAPVLVYNIDTYVEPEFLSPAAVRGNGWVPCFPGEGDAWSFARLGEDGLVAELAEKRRVSPHASIGLYWFRSFALYEECYREHFASGTASERYIAPMYNTLIAQDGGVYLSLVPARAVCPLGTPAEVEAFQRAS